ncbi:S-adenosyl-L-methionine-dependent methyltransferase [Stachybotrys elegans]|uniref:DNA (cytosine-5-)-methyltransferase n=1 Tax=Stachybotrys elegans TaxID=80388 RepID=A0A8K0SIE6_9HYPO|nr:S-adenosyl-L-methionine-dependent methyltransferase [Stachybotrys elegans]
MPAPDYQGGSRSRSSSVSSTCTLGREEPPVVDLFEDEVIDLTRDDGIQLYNDPGRPRGFVHSSAGVIRHGDLIEIREIQMGNHFIDFLHVKSTSTVQGQAIIRGVPFVRTTAMRGKLPKKPNELCMFLHQQIEDGSAVREPLLVEINPRSVIRKRKLVVTNAIYPHHNPHIQPRRDARQQSAIRQSGWLVCRWKMTVLFTLRGRQTKPEEEIIERIRWDEVTEPAYRVSNDVLRNQWRGGRVKGGSWSPVSESEGVTVCLDEACEQDAGRTRRYTLFDAFSGAGGVSRGAQSAGFKVAYAVDKEATVWQTYKANFPEAKLFEMPIDEVVRVMGHVRANILHLSPPCQFFSPAHTIAAAHDDENIFALFACSELIRRVKPRLITLEETFGLTFERHQIFFRALIQQLTQFGYSVRWRVVRLCTWGSSQDRKRLILLAAGPGEELPTFPEATHSDGTDGLKPFRTVRRAIERIRPGDDLHNLETVRQFESPRVARDPSGEYLAGTITTGGGGLYYPDGTRNFTLRELASLQGFPLDYKFLGDVTSIKRQIGNAFPPNTVKVLYNHLRNWLLRQDGVAPHWEHEDAVTVEDDTSSAVHAGGIMANESIAIIADEDVEMCEMIDLT